MGVQSDPSTSSRPSNEAYKSPSSNNGRYKVQNRGIDKIKTIALQLVNLLFPEDKAPDDAILSETLLLKVRSSVEVRIKVSTKKTTV